MAGWVLNINLCTDLPVVQGVESVRCSSFSAALKAGHPVYTQSDSTLADGMCYICLELSLYLTVWVHRCNLSDLISTALAGA